MKPILPKYFIKWVFYYKNISWVYFSLKSSKYLNDRSFLLFCSILTAALKMVNRYCSNCKESKSVSSGDSYFPACGLLLAQSQSPLHRRTTGSLVFIWKFIKWILLVGTEKHSWRSRGCKFFIVRKNIVSFEQ